MKKQNLEILYQELAKKNNINGEDYDRAKYYFESLASFYPQISIDKKINDLMNNNSIKLSDFSLGNMLKSNKASMNVQVMDNKEIRSRVVDGNTGASYVVVDAKAKDSGGSPHQNSHEHYYTIEVCRVEDGYAIAAELLNNGNVLLSRYDKGQYWASVPGYVHNTSLKDGSHTTTLKTPSILPDWYGTGNIINSELAYYVDSCTKTLDLDQMNYIIKMNSGLVDEKMKKEFKLDQKWDEICSTKEISPYEVLITKDNREQMRKLLLVTKNNDLAAFYANLTNKNIELATQIATMTKNDINIAIEYAQSKYENINIEKSKEFAKIKKLAK